MRSLVRILLLTLIACGAAWGAPAGNEPYAGYVYPAGGRQGTTFRVIVGGQRLRNVSEALVSGQGVRASVVGYVGPLGPLNLLQQEELRRRLQKIASERAARFPGIAKRLQKAPAKPAESAQPVELPDLPELRNLEQMTAPQLRAVADKFLNRQKRPKPPIAEEVTLEIAIDPNAAPGDRELRLQAPNGLTNPLIFQVGTLPEIREPDKDEIAPAPLKPVQAPVVLNGQIMPGEVDRFPLQLKGGQSLIIAVEARKLIPYLADAVPGWFQAAVAIRDADGKELAYQDDCGFDPDPALAFKVPKDGAYTLEIRDAIYRGREDFVYRVAIADPAGVRPLFPSGSRGGVPICATAMDQETCQKQALSYFHAAGPALSEKEPNDTGKTANRVALPRIVAGSIGAPGDRDVFAVEGRAGETLVAEVCARRMGSPVDSLVRLIDRSGRVVAWNDDNGDPESGLLTHHADSYLMAKLPAAGRYFVQVSDAQGHGGPEYRYCLRIGPPQPDFAVRITPSSLSVPASGAVVMTAYAVRKDGWDGDIELALKDAPAGFALSGARIPKGRDHIRLTLLAPPRKLGAPVALSLEGRAQIGGKTVSRPAVPADDRMQAFAYHHLVPSEQLMVLVNRWAARAMPKVNLGGDRLRIPAGGTAEVTCPIRTAIPRDGAVHFEISEPPPGVTLQSTSAKRNGFSMIIKADDKHIGYADNLIVEAFAEIETQGPKGGQGQKRRIVLGVLPAIPFEIVKP